MKLLEAIEQEKVEFVSVCWIRWYNRPPDATEDALLELAAQRLIDYSTVTLPNGFCYLTDAGRAALESASQKEGK